MLLHVKQPLSSNAVTSTTYTSPPRRLPQSPSRQKLGSEIPDINTETSFAVISDSDEYRVAKSAPSAYPVEHNGFVRTSRNSSEDPKTENSLFRSTSSSTKITTDSQATRRKASTMNNTLNVNQPTSVEKSTPRSLPPMVGINAGTSLTRSKQTHPQDRRLDTIVDVKLAARSQSPALPDGSTSLHRHIRYDNLSPFSASSVGTSVPRSESAGAFSLVTASTPLTSYSPEIDTYPYTIHGIPSSPFDLERSHQHSNYDRNNRIEDVQSGKDFKATQRGKQQVPPEFAHLLHDRTRPSTPASPPSRKSIDSFRRADATPPTYVLFPPQNGHMPASNAPSSPTRSTTSTPYFGLRARNAWEIPVSVPSESGRRLRKGPAAGTGYEGYARAVRESHRDMAAHVNDSGYSALRNTDGFVGETKGRTDNIESRNCNGGHVTAPRITSDLVTDRTGAMNPESMSPEGSRPLNDMGLPKDLKPSLTKKLSMASLRNADSVQSFRINFLRRSSSVRSVENALSRPSTARTRRSVEENTVPRLNSQTRRFAVKPDISGSGEHEMPDILDAPMMPTAKDSRFGTHRATTPKVRSSSSIWPFSRSSTCCMPPACLPMPPLQPPPLEVRPRSHRVRSAATPQVSKIPESVLRRSASLHSFSLPLTAEVSVVAEQEDNVIDRLAVPTSLEAPQPPTLQYVHSHRISHSGRPNKALSAISEVSNLTARQLTSVDTLPNVRTLSRFGDFLSLPPLRDSQASCSSESATFDFPNVPSAQSDTEASQAHHYPAFRTKGFDSLTSNTGKPTEQMKRSSDYERAEVENKESSRGRLEAAQLNISESDVAHAPVPGTSISFTLSDLVDFYDDEIDNDRSQLRFSANAQCLAEAFVRSMSNLPETDSVHPDQQTPPQPVEDSSRISNLEQRTSSGLRFGALMTSKWLSFGRVLFSPAHRDISEKTDSRVLVVDGLGNDWSYYCALTYPTARVHTLGPTVDDTSLSRSSSSGSSSILGWKSLPNHFQHLHTSLHSEFPFPPNFFAAVVVRFLPAMPESQLAHILAECKRVLYPGGHVEISGLDLDLANMGSRARRGVRELKTRLHLADGSVCLKPASDTMQLLLGRRGFANLNRCVVGVPVAGAVPSSSSSPSSSPPRRDDVADVDFAELIKDQSPEGDEGISNMVARVGRWWYSRSYETGVAISGGSGGTTTTTTASMWHDKALLKECEQRRTTFKLLICYAQKPLVETRRTASV